MADVIKCPACGESNLPDQEFCQYCRTRLEPLTGALKGADAPIKPGQVPTTKTTAELEPILPQWLRDARDSARKSAGGDPTPEEKQKQESFTASTSSFDLLAGLQSQKEGNDEEEETPDWLASITGDSPKSKKDQAGSSEVHWVELGGASDFAQEEKPEEESTASSNENADLNEWFRDANASQTPQQPDQSSVSDDFFSTSPASSDTPDWLRQMVADSESQNDRELPVDSGNAPVFSDSPDWLRNFSADDGAQNNTAKEADGALDAASASPVEEPDWLRALGGSQGQTQSAGPADFSGAGSGTPEAAEGSSADKLPEWMQNFPSTESDKPKQPTVPLPAWLKEETSAASEETDLPSWLSG